MTTSAPLDRSLQALTDGYTFWQQLRPEPRATVRTRLLGSRAISISGADAVRFFYETPGLERSTALPEPVVGTLFGKGAVHTLDGDDHRHRKQLFTSLLDAKAAWTISANAVEGWQRRAAGWDGEVDLGVAARAVLLEAVTAWAGVEVDDLGARSRDMMLMVDGFGNAGARGHVKARRARGRSERWIAEQVRHAREGAPLPTPLSDFAGHRDRDGNLLDERVAAVEVLNVLRPTTAVSWFLLGGAYAFERFPHLRQGLLDGDFSALDLAHELRRRLPFAPYLAARATRELEYRGTPIPPGALVVLDLWGTDHDPGLYERPDALDPSRFTGREPTPYDLVPQGGGDRERGHRCPGEDVTLALLVALLPELAKVPFRLTGSTRVPMDRMPPHLSGRSVVQPADA
jgi:fatty-acid peroxygenase